MPVTKQQLTDFKQLFKESVSELVRDEAFISQIADVVVKTVSATLTDTLKNFEEKTAKLEMENKTLSRKIDYLEQYSRRTNIRMFGIVEEKAENVEEKVVKIFKDIMKVNIDSCNIDRCHRIGQQKKNGAIRGIMIKFNNYKSKQEVMSRKTKLKGSKIVITEDLTKHRHLLFKQAQEHFGKRKVWTLDGTIFVAAADGDARHRATCQEELNNIIIHGSAT